MDLLPHIKLETADAPDASVIWLHGLGANGHDFEPIVNELNLPQTATIRYIFPHYPSIPVTINGGYIMPAWYDILEMSIDRKVDFKQLLVSVAQINQFIDREVQQGIDSKRIVIAGFSQGGAVALHSALTYSQPLAGLLAMSTYFATQDTITISGVNKSIPIEIHHGTADPVVPVQLGQNCTARLKAMGCNPEFRAFNMEHAVCAEQIQVISGWIKKVLSI